MSTETAAQIMAPEEQVSIRGGIEKVTVRKLNWRELTLFMKSFAPYLSELMETDGQGLPQINTAKLVGVMIANLGEELVLATTGKEREWIGELYPEDMLALASKAIDMNLTSAFVANAKLAGSRLRGLTTPATSQTPTTSFAE